jgi:hypothetical protein
MIRLLGSPFPDDLLTSIDPPRGLALVVQKELAKDIEANGGLEKFVGDDPANSKRLADLLDSKPSSYGLTSGSCLSSIEPKNPLSIGLKSMSSSITIAF